MGILQGKMPEWGAQIVVRKKNKSNHRTAAGGDLLTADASTTAKLPVGGRSKRWLEGR